MDELEDVINRPFFKEYVDEEFRDFLIKTIKEKSIIIKPRFDENAVPDDKDDNKFVNCALTANAVIVSGDTHLIQVKNYKGIKVYTANEFLDSI